jgi:hypothetical protein
MEKTKLFGRGKQLMFMDAQGAEFFKIMVNNDKKLYNLYVRMLSLEG